MNDTIKPFGDILNQVLPGVFGQLSSKTSEEKTQTEEKKMCSKSKKHCKKDKKAKKEQKMTEEKEEKFDASALAKKVAEEVPEFHLNNDILESIITENGFTTVEQV